MPTGEYSIQFILTRPPAKRRFDVFWRHIGGLYGLAVPLLASLTPSGFKVEIVDQATQRIDFESGADIIALSLMTSNAVEGYSIADRFRELGKTVVIGGIHPSAVPQETKQHADAVAIGEGDLIWPQILQDFADGELQPFYESSEVARLDDLPMPRHDLLPRFSRRIGMASIQTTRGCPYDCAFCSITSVFGRRFRKRPIRDVIREIKHLHHRLLNMVDDNIVADPNYAGRFFRELTTLGIRWVAQSDISIAEDDELLELAAQSGCIGLYIGLESIHQEDLEAIGKGRNSADRYEFLLKKIQKHGIMTGGSFIFGIDGHGPGIFEETLGFAKRVGLAYAFMPILTPFPGTRIFKQFESEGRIFHTNWEYYDASHVVYEPHGMSPEELREGWLWATREFSSLSSTIQRLWAAPIQLRYNFTINAVNHVHSRFDTQAHP
jgi:radical SAM superfamily enzyme YgiQ (UPF0313 family)